MHQNSGRSAVVAGLSVAAVVIAGCYHAKGNYTGLSKTSSPKQLSAQIVSGSFVVEPRTVKQFTVAVASDMAHPRLEGSFTASGANNDIEVMLLEASQFQNWEKRSKFTVAYQSGRVTSDKLAIPLPAQEGTYYVVFSNRFSLISNKAVVADIVLHCDKGKKQAPARTAY